MKFLFLLSLSAIAALAQTKKVVELKWEDTINPSNTTYSIYRTNGLCSGTPPFAKISTGLSDKLFTDTTVTPGLYCYMVTANLNGIESAPSNAATATVPPQAITTLQAEVK